MDEEPRMHLDDDEMSLQSKLVGGGRDLGEEASTEETRLCPACGRVTTFIQGKCSNCDYKPGSGAMPAYEQPYVVQGGGSIGRILIWAVVIVVVLIAGFMGYRALSGKKAPAKTETPAAGGQAAAPATGEAATQPQTHPGSLAAMTIDDAFRSKVKELLVKANADWKEAGTICYIYRFSIFEKTVPATSQTITISLFAGGEQADAGIGIPKNAPLTKNLDPYIAELNANAGVHASYQTYNTGGDEPPAAESVYVVYGYYYGKEHMAELKPIIDALENTRRADGHYPAALDKYIVNPPIRTNGGFSYVESGYGYLPIYETGAGGNIVMGEGNGIDSMMPKAVAGYYLFEYTPSPNDGMDLFSSSDLRYYIDKISSLPYEVKEPLHNVALHPDGKPDGVACYFKNGELQS